MPPSFQRAKRKLPLDRFDPSFTWDNAELRDISFSEESEFNDAFVLRQVSQEFVSDAAFVSGLIPILRAYLTALAAATVTEQRCSDLIATMEEAGDFLTPNSRPRRTRQKLLRNLHVVETLVEIVIASERFRLRRGNEEDSKGMVSPEALCQRLVDVSNAAFALLENHLQGNSRKNELYLAGHIPFFQSHIGSPLHVMKMYTQLVRDNHIIVDQIAEAQIPSIVSLLSAQREKDSDLLDFLSVLCEVEGRPIEKNQTMICNLLRGSSGADEQNGTPGHAVAGAAVYTTVLDNAERTVMVTTPADPEGVSLMTLCHDPTRRRQAVFLEKQLSLFGSLCAGRNEHTRNVIVEDLKYLTWDECFHGIVGEEGVRRGGTATSTATAVATSGGKLELPPAIRAKYVELCVNLFIDQGKQHDKLSHVTLSLSSSKTIPSEGPPSAGSIPPSKPAWEESQPAARLEALNDQQLGEIRKWLAGFLHSEKSVNQAHLERNHLLVSVLRLLNKLIELGFYDSDEVVDEIMKPLALLVDGRNDKAPHKGQSIQNDVVVEVKLAAISSINCLLNHCTNLSLQRVFADFESALNGMETSEDRRRHSKSERFFQAVRRRADASDAGQRRYGETAKTQQRRYGNLFHKLVDTARQIGGEPHQGSHVRQEDANDESLRTARNYVGDVVAQTNRVAKAYADLPGALLQLASYDYENLLIAAISLYNRCFTYTEDLFRYCQEARVLCSPESHRLAGWLARNIPILRRIAAARVQEKSALQFVDIVDQLTQSCFQGTAQAPGAEPGTESPPNSINQMLIVNTGVVHTLVDVAQSTIDEGQIQPIPALRAVYRCLRALCVECDLVQRQMFAMLHIWLDSRNLSEPGYLDELAGMVAEIFTHNQDLCLSVRNSHISGMMELLRVSPITSTMSFKALQSIMRVEELGLSLYRTQSYVIQGVIEHQEKMLQRAFLFLASPDAKAKRIALLQDRGGTDGALRRYHLNLVDLLASCAERNSEFINSLCQPVLSISDIAIVIMDSEVSDAAKRIYMRFLLWVYLTDLKSPSDLPPVLLEKVRLWEVLARLSETLSEKDELSPLISCVEMAMLTDVANIDALARLKEGMEKRLLSCQVKVRRNPRAHNRRPTREEDTRNRMFNEFARLLQVAYNGANSVQAQLGHELAADTVLPVRYRHALQQGVSRYCETAGIDEALPLGPAFQLQVTELLCPADQTTGPIDQGAKLPNRVSRGSSFKSVNERHLDVFIRLLFASIQLTSSKNSRERSQQSLLDQRVLQWFRAVLHNNICVIEQAICCANRNSSFKTEQRTREELEPKARELASLQAQLAVAVPVVVEMLKSDDDAIVCEALACISTMLRDGNKAVQRAFELYFESTREEAFFAVVRDRLQRSVTLSQDQRQLRSQARGRDILGLVEDPELQPILVGAHERKPLSNPDAGSRSEPLELTPIPVGVSCPPALTSSTDDARNVKLVLRMLQNVCEGHNNKLKGYMQHQQDNFKVIDVVTATVHFVKEYTKGGGDMTESRMEVVVQAVDTLVELAQGHEKNQGVILDAGAVDFVNHVLKPDIAFGQAAAESVRQLRMSAGNLIVALLESHIDEGRTMLMAREVDETLKTEHVLGTMCRCWYVYAATYLSAGDEPVLLDGSPTRHLPQARLFIIDCLSGEATSGTWPLCSTSSLSPSRSALGRTTLV